VISRILRLVHLTLSTPLMSRSRRFLQSADRIRDGDPSRLRRSLLSSQMPRVTLRPNSAAIFGTLLDAASRRVQPYRPGIRGAIALKLGADPLFGRPAAFEIRMDGCGERRI